MEKNLWIKKKLNEFVGETSQVYSLYEQFLNETNSTCSMESFKRKVRKIKKDLNYTDTSDTNQLSIEEKDNVIEVTSKSTSVSTLKDLIKVAKINLDNWQIERHVINSWEMASKINDIICKTPLYQIKAWLIPKNLTKPKFKLLHPIDIPKINMKKSKDKKNTFKKALVISDAHIGYKREFDMQNHSYNLIPFHDRFALDAVIQLAKKEQPDTIILNGDFLDVPDWTDKYVHSPDYYYLLQPALIELSWWLLQLRKSCVNSKIIYNTGNHEERLNKHMMRRLPVAFDLKNSTDINGSDLQTLPKLLQLEKLDIEWTGNYEHSQYWLNNITKVEHGNRVSQGSGSTIRNLIKESNFSVIIGHIHRDEFARKRIRKFQNNFIQIFAASVGTLALLDGNIPAANSKDKLNWQQSIGMVYYDDDNISNFQHIPIIDGKILFNNNYFVGNNYDISFGEEFNKSIN